MIVYNAWLLFNSLRNYPTREIFHYSLKARTTLQCFDLSKCLHSSRIYTALARHNTINRLQSTCSIANKNAPENPKERDRRSRLDKDTYYFEYTLFTSRAFAIRRSSGCIRARKDVFVIYTPTQTYVYEHSVALFKISSAKNNIDFQRGGINTSTPAASCSCGCSMCREHIAPRRAANFYLAALQVFGAELCVL